MADRQAGFWVVEHRLRQLSERGDPLEKLAATVDFEIFRAALFAARGPRDRSKGGRPPFDPVLKLRMLVLQAMHGLSLAQTEFLVADRLSWMRFCGLGPGDAVPDANTLWDFREALIAAGALDALFAKLDRAITEAGYLPMAGQIVDATPVAAPRQRNCQIVLIHDLKRQGLSVTAIARKVGCDRKTVRKYLDRGLEAPVYGPRPDRPSVLDPYRAYLRERVAAFPDLSGRRLLREIQDMGYEGSYSTLKPFRRDIRPPAWKPFERRFETPSGKQAQVDFAEFAVEFTDEPGKVRKVWLFSLVLGHSRWLWGRFVASQNLQSVMRCHIAAFAAMGGAPEEILYDRMKTAVIGEDEAGVVTYNASLVALLNHYGTIPKACRPYRAKTKGKVERPFRYIRQDFFLARSFRSIEDLNAQFDAWRTGVANPRSHATTGRVVDEAFAEEKPSLKALPPIPYSAVLTVTRRVSHEGMVAVDGNFYSVPDTTRRRMLEVQNHTDEIRIFEDGALIARHPVLEGKNRRRKHRLRLCPRPQACGDRWTSMTRSGVDWPRQEPRNE